MKEKLRIAAMVLLVAALLLMAGGFWTFVGVQAEKEKTIEESEKAEQVKEQKGGIEVMYIALGAKGDEYVFAYEGGLCCAEIPEGELYDENGREISVNELYTGDILKLYGDIVVLESYPGQLTGVEMMVRDSKGSVEDAKPYAADIQEFCGMPIYGREREDKSLLDDME
ncbi:MAG: hypothetical protein Q4C77_14345 [Eubacteriales bacterium]|nr:hypothetical protein [Eubacteriales bacterium]